MNFEFIGISYSFLYILLFYIRFITAIFRLIIEFLFVMSTEISMFFNSYTNTAFFKCLYNILTFYILSF